jgi:hypothetical protein
MIPATSERVTQNTAEEINQRIQRETAENIAATVAGGRAAIDQRLRELDQEWDMERTLETNAASVALFGLGLGAFFDRRWFALPAVVCGFLLQHAVQGWCPPVPIFRRRGVRTMREIDEERFALKALRGDFQGVRAADDFNGHGADVTQALEAARK